ncbi:MAG: BolA/IbaG family iron-sulfur metabolism protein [Candidatus Melainabacteria bacterium]|nr:BolA/IbaG family iron-sulfur metabolism protein [Candidatus Melainabacteria bacterium]
MIPAENLVAILKEAFPNSVVEVYDTTGTLDHYVIYICSEAFVGKNTMARHRLVQAVTAPLVADGRLHATELKLAVPTVSV